MSYNLFSSYLDFIQPLIINKKSFPSRLMIGTGKYKNLRQAQLSIKNSGASIVTVAVRRAYNIKLKGRTNLIDGLDWKKLWLLPNTAGCETIEEAIRVAILGREMAKRLGQVDNNFIKLEVISDPRYLFPDPYGTLKAAEYLINKNFTVLPYISPDPILAKQLEEIGCATVMPLGSPIGSGQGICSLSNLQIIIDNAKIPVIIDAGIGTASEASQAMEMGASGVLLNTAVAKSFNPPYMAEAMKLGVMSGRIAYLSGRILKQNRAIASSPSEGKFVK
uniref:Thiazole synthase n=2 Tax=Gracilariopsis TaxID=2781 RepID=A0A1C9CF29_9FLOR|nr:thiazole biosynthesis protein ThiG [Gracilariopsis lemaneiformis]YP_009294731.1 thiamin biosynthesis protein G [Gracilariopsis chorda]AJO68375.1 thiamin biosynthesis protein G [Gracilariopsis lemaneiformis]AML79932.1 thiazole biosynthesis protein ThiG [Gracilariopsis lemaneiformis]AOM66991.1 thiamin biosynthesis protein G [Gracilariopsis chorda]UAD88747.1 Thiamine biosynthesis protein G [Gracilariopsis chorda]